MISRMSAVSKKGYLIAGIIIVLLALLAIMPLGVLASPTIAPQSTSNYQLALHLYTRCNVVNNRFGHLATYVSNDGIYVIHVPVTPGAVPSTQLLAVLDQIGHIFSQPNAPGRAFWGWFTNETLTASGRIGTMAGPRPPGIAPGTNAGLRRPALSTTCQLTAVLTAIENATTPAAIQALFGNDSTLNLFGAWSLWGDVNDDDRICDLDEHLLRSYVLLIAGPQHLNLNAADVLFDGEVCDLDHNLLRRYLLLLAPFYHLGMAAQQPTPNYQIALHLYTRCNIVNNRFGHLATHVSDGIRVINMPVTPGAAPSAELLAVLDEIGHIFSQSNAPGRAFWGWFTDETLTASGRIGAAAGHFGPGTNAGLRRPALSDTCQLTAILTAIENATTPAAIQALFGNGSTLNLFGAWSLWGDVNDDDIICDLDEHLLRSYVLDIAGPQHLNLNAANVLFDDEVCDLDHNLLRRYLLLLAPFYRLGMRQPEVTVIFICLNTGEMTPPITRFADRRIRELPEPTPRDNYTFMGWFTAPFGGARITPDWIVPFHDVAYFAQWQRN